MTEQPNTTNDATTDTTNAAPGWRPVGSFRVRCPNPRCDRHGDVKVVPILGCDGIVMLAGMMKCGRCLTDVEAVNKELRDVDRRLVPAARLGAENADDSTDQPTTTTTTTTTATRRRRRNDPADHPKMQQATRPRTRKAIR